LGLSRIHNFVSILILDEPCDFSLRASEAGLAILKKAKMPELVVPLGLPQPYQVE
jgi:hypothetical protein